jgi:hypothetical protein
LNDLEACGRSLLESLLTRGTPPTPPELQSLTRLPAAALDEALRQFAARHGAAALGVLTALAAEPSPRAVRRAAKRALYRLAQGGVTPPPAPATPPAAAGRGPLQAVRAWASGIDGSGSRAVWVLFEGAWGALRLCSVILNDTAGILESAGGEITKKRLDRELAELRAEQKLPWVSIDPDRAMGLIAEALALHEAAGTTPPAPFARWQPLFAATPPATLPAPGDPDPALAERAGALLEAPEFAGWFLEPASVQSDALELLQARESRLVLSDQQKAERQEAILRRVVERELTPAARRLWGRRLGEMALVLAEAGRGEHAAIARAAAIRLLDEQRDVGREAFARGLAARALAAAGEVALGRLSPADVSRAPERAPRPTPPA